MKILLTPGSFHPERDFTDDTERILKDILECLHLRKLLQLTFTHGCKVTTKLRNEKRHGRFYRIIARIASYGEVLSANAFLSSP